MPPQSNNADDDPFAAYQKPLVTGTTPKSATPKSGDDPFAAYQTPLAAPDFINGKGGTYKMVAPDQTIKDIPYSNVMAASDAGWKMQPHVHERYASDRKAEVLKTQPKITEQDYLKAMRLPEALPEKPGLWGRVEGAVQKYTEPTSVFPGIPTNLTDPAAGEMGLNVIKRVGRTLFGLADFTPQAFSALKDSLSADPKRAAEGEERMLAMHPAKQVVGRLKELRDDWKRDPKIAGENLAGDAVAIWLADKVAAAPVKGAKVAGEYLTETLPTRMIAKLIRPSAADVKFGKMPARALLDEGIVGNSLRELGDKAYRRLDQLGKEMDRQATLPANASKTIDVSPSLQPIDDALVKAQKAGDAGLYNRLNGLKTELIYEWNAVPGAGPGGTMGLEQGWPRNLSHMSPEQALQFKRIIGDKIRWTGDDPFENAANAALGEVYGGIRDQVNLNVPGLRELNSRYSNLVGAAKAIERRLPIEERNSAWSLSDIVLGATHHLPLAMGRKIVTWPGFKTRAAGALYGVASHPDPAIIPPPPSMPRRVAASMGRQGAQYAALAGAAGLRAKTLQELRRDQKDWENLNPNATSQQKAQHFAELVQRNPSASQPAFKPVKMRAPDGSIEEVPYDQVDHYKSEGATEVKSE